MKVSARLKKIAYMVKYPMLFDVGSDHALLPIFAIKQGLATSAVATDINPGPLARAEQNIELFGLGNAIKTRLTSGLDGLTGTKNSTCIIAGMGGILVNGIIKQNLQTALAFGQIIIQPQRDVPDVRRFILSNGFKIDDEEMVEERGKFYNILDCSPGAGRPYDEISYLFGKHLIEKRPTVFIKFVQTQQQKTRRIISALDRRSPRGAELEKYLQFCEKLGLEAQND